MLSSEHDEAIILMNSEQLLFLYKTSMGPSHSHPRAALTGLSELFLIRE